jgi:hypothetical protein
MELVAQAIQIGSLGGHQVDAKGAMKMEVDQSG